MKCMLVLVSLVLVMVGCCCAGRLDSSKGSHTSQAKDAQVFHKAADLRDGAELFKCNATGEVCYNECPVVNRTSYYQYCRNCSSFLICPGNAFANCPPGLYFTQTAPGNGSCVSQSSTCHECYVPPKCTNTGPRCLNHTSSTCEFLNDNNYQLCYNCTSYIQCTSGQATIRHCSPELKYDDRQKTCVVETTTCAECFSWLWCNSTGPQCITNCVGRPDGNYQSCYNCWGYITCTSNHTWERLCPSGTYWDDNALGCVDTSTTCTHCAPNNKCDITGDDCRLRCVEEEDGFYQSCRACNQYLECKSEASIFHTCPGNYVWDNLVYACVPSSRTCEECVLPLKQP